MLMLTFYTIREIWQEEIRPFIRNKRESSAICVIASQAHSPFFVLPRCFLAAPATRLDPFEVAFSHSEQYRSVHIASTDSLSIHCILERPEDTLASHVMKRRVAGKTVFLSYRGAIFVWRIVLCLSIPIPAYQRCL